MNLYRLPISSSSSDSEEEERRERIAKEDREIDEMIEIATRTLIPQLISAITPRRRRRRRQGGKNQPRHDRVCESGHIRLFNDYFAERPVYSDALFRRKFRMRKEVFLRIMNRVTASDEWFRQKRDAAAGRLGLSPLQKFTAAIRMLTYGITPNILDEYVCMSESTARAALQHFTWGVISEFGNQYLRRLTPQDLERLLQFGEERGFPGMIGSIDCMHWEWENCPTAWKDKFQGRNEVTTLVLEAAVDRDLWIWHSLFGIAGSCNDLHVLHRSPVFNDILEGRAPPVNFTVNGHKYNKGYYLTDGIYPKWSTFVKPIIMPQTPKDKLFAQHQEAARKDVERAFRVLQARFAIIRQPSIAWDTNILHNIMLCCVIMHNMIVENERDSYVHYADTSYFPSYCPQQRPHHAAALTNDEPFQYNTNRILDINIYLQNRADIREQQMHLARRQDLVEHIWNKYGGN